MIFENKSRDHFLQKFLAALMQRFDHQHMWASAGSLKEVAFLHKSETLVKPFDVGAAVAPDSRSLLCKRLWSQKVYVRSSKASTRLLPSGNQQTSSEQSVRGAGRDCFLTESVGFLGPIPSLQMRG